MDRMALEYLRLPHAFVRMLMSSSSFMFTKVSRGFELLTLLKALQEINRVLRAESIICLGDVIKSLLIK